MGKSMHLDLGAEVTKRVIGAAITVHRTLGPGLEEADYERALHLELLALGIEHYCQVPLPLVYNDVKLDCGYRVDLLIPQKVLLELKVAEKPHPVHQAQLLTYLKLSGMPLGLLMNFNVLMLRDGILRRANTLPSETRTLAPLATPGGFDELSQEVVAAALTVQLTLGRGLLRSAYEACLAYELSLRGIKTQRGMHASFHYREQLISSNKTIPLLVEDRLMVACHCVSDLDPLHLARDRSLLRAVRVETGLSINFHAHSLAADIRRIQVTL